MLSDGARHIIQGVAAHSVAPFSFDCDVIVSISRLGDTGYHGKGFPIRRARIPEVNVTIQGSRKGDKK